MLIVEFSKLLNMTTKQQLLLSKGKCEHCYLLFQRRSLPLPKTCPTKMKVSSEGNGKWQGNQTWSRKQDLGLPYQ